jgi:hypothetical protein
MFFSSLGLGIVNAKGLNANIEKYSEINFF